MRGFCLEVGGDFACFTRPEMKVERVSYDVITPSAARAIFEAILWKPAIRWHVTRIEVLNPIRWASIRRNEVSNVANEGSAGFCIDDIKNDGKPKYRQQRAGLLLRNVKYRLHAEFDFIPPEKRCKTINRTPEWLTDEEEEELYRQAEATPRPDEKAAKYAAMFERRATKGQCFTQPYLGCREFACSFRLVKNPETEPTPIDESRDLGFMLYDLDYSDSNDIKPMFFRANMEKGSIKVPDEDSKEVRK
jgi:CRISPR-associated protein Cas5d